MTTQRFDVKDRAKGRVGVNNNKNNSDGFVCFVGSENFFILGDEKSNTF